MAELNWEILAQESDDGEIEALASSFVFGFKDEVAIRMVSVEGKTKLDIRSRSRIGKIDRGANARRIHKFIKILKSKF